MRVTVTSDSLIGYDISHAFALVKEAGLDGIEIYVKPELFDTYDVEYLKKLSEAYALPIVALYATVGLSEARAEKLLSLASALSVPVVSVAAPEFFDFSYKKWLESEMRVLRKKYQIHIALVNPPAGTNQLWLFPKFGVSSIPELKTFPDLTLDTSNSYGGDNLLDMYAALKENVVHIHLGNVKNEARHQLLENGQLPLESLLTRLARDGYAGCVSLRFDPKALSAGDATKVVATLREAKAFIEKYSIAA